MSYCRSVYRNEFDTQAADLLHKAKLAERLGKSYPTIRDSVFQCAVLLLVAALETYLKLLVEAWVQKLKSKNFGTKTPDHARAFIAAKKLDRAFALYHYDGNEKALYTSLMAESSLWPFLAGTPQLPAFFNGKALHDGAAYPTSKNIKKLFARLGVQDMIARLSRNLSRDVEVLIDSLQSIRTALAHSSPPPLTLSDVERHLTDCKALVGSIDRIFWAHVKAHGGSDCWTA